MSTTIKHLLDRLRWQTVDGKAHGDGAVTHVVMRDGWPVVTWRCERRWWAWVRSVYRRVV